MAYTYSKIASVTVGSGGSSSIDFLAIPQNYTDLVIKMSVRTNRSGSTFDGCYMTFNNNTSGRSARWLEGNGASASSGTSSELFNGVATGATATASTFSNIEIYIPNYTGSNYKSYSADSAHETNATTAYTDLTAGLWSNSSPIDQINIYTLNAASFVQYSTATLYGIKAEV